MEASAAAYVAMADSEEFRALKHRHRRAVLTVTALAIIWYLAFVLVAVFAPAFMATPVFGSVNIGLLFGLLQFVSTFAIAIWYVGWANKKFDPAADALHAQLVATAAANAVQAAPATGSPVVPPTAPATDEEVR